MFGGALYLPSNISYMCLDIATLLALKGIDKHTERYKLVPFREFENKQHNAPIDARISK
jgi:hypothetical protein